MIIQKDQLMECYANYLTVVVYAFEYNTFYKLIMYSWLKYYRSS